MASVLELFLDKISAENGVSLSTINAYSKDLEQFLCFINVDPCCITPNHISSFIKNLTDKHFAVKTLNRKISAIRSFCKFLLEEKMIAQNPLPDITMPKREKLLPKFLNNQQIEQLYQKAISHNNNAFKRIGVIIKLMFASGLRVSEIVEIPLNAINHNKKQITVKGKGAKERIIFFNEEINTFLFDYINNVRPFFLNKKRTSPFLFPSKRAAKGHLSRDAFFKDLKLLAVECGFSPTSVSPHVLRHSFATNLINHDADLRSIQKMLGHENIATTEIYTHITHQKIINSVFEKHPLNKRSNP